jgi:hypothetical protein
MHSSFWRGLAPTTDLFVRRLNLGHYDREFAEMKFATAPARRGIINEIAFSAFCKSSAGQVSWPPPPLTTAELDEAVSYVLSQSVRREARAEFQWDGDLSAEERLDIEEQRNRLVRVFSFNRPAGSLVLEPSFPGCGIIDTSKGDLIASNTLFEVKAGDRLFRSVDVRQLVMYGSLNYISRKFRIDRFGLFNPRIGVSANIPVDDLCIEISGKPSADLFSEITSAISSGEISR